MSCGIYPFSQDIFPDCEFTASTVLDKPEPVKPAMMNAESVILPPDMLDTSHDIEQPSTSNVYISPKDILPKYERKLSSNLR